MYLVMAFSFCIFIWLLGTVKAPDVRFDSEKPVVITGPEAILSWFVRFTST